MSVGVSMSPPLPPCGAFPLPTSELWSLFPFATLVWAPVYVGSVSECVVSYM